MDQEPKVVADRNPDRDRSKAVLSALRRVILATDVNAKELAKATGLTTSQLLVLQLLEGGAPNTITGLAKHVNLMQATVTTIVDRLEERGYVVRSKSEQDRRRVHVLLTDTGREVLGRAPRLLQSLFLQNYEKAPDWQQSMMIAVLELIADMMNAGSIDASPILDIGAVDRSETRTGSL